MKRISKHAARKRNAKSRLRIQRPSGGSLADLARLSHEIRTPLNVLLGVLELALDTPLNPQQQEYFKLMRSAGKSLMTVVCDLLEFSRIESGELRLERTPFSLRALLDETAALLSLEAANKSLRIRCELSPGLPDRLLGDPGRLRQIIVNLLANAIKFSAAGEIVIGVSGHPAEAGEAGLHFSIADCGPGIDPEAGRRLFAPFRQAEASTWREHGGSGLGLSIVARLVAMMGGRVWLESQPGRGSTFHFTAILAGEPRDLAEPSGSGSLAGSAGDDALDLMVIDDSAMNRRFCEILLQQAGFRVATFAGAADALPLLALWRPDAVLIDLEMPEIDGFAATAAIRRDESRRRQTPLTIIALTAHVDARVEKRCRDAGMDGCIAKPVDPAAVTAIVARPRHASAPSPAALHCPPHPRGAGQAGTRATQPNTSARLRARKASTPPFAAVPPGIRRSHPNYPSRRFSP